MFLQLSDDDKLMLLALALALVFGLVWWWNKRAKRWLEETGRLDEPASALDWLLGGRQQEPVTTLRYSEREFQEMVANALDEVPEEFDKEWKNVAVVVSTDWPTEEDKKRMNVPESHSVLGSYSGLDRTKGFRAESSSQHVIVIYQPALEQLFGSDKQRLQQEIRRTVLHELAHHLGISHQRMKKVGL